MTLEIFTKLTKHDNNYGFSETIKTEINQLAIIPILSDSIYKDPLSAIRELYNNEVTACKNSKLDTRIEIKLDTNTRELSIRGYNSMGITREIFDKILKVMGNSGNNSGDRIGLYGLGFFSHVKLSEKMIIHSYAQNNEYFSFISKSGLSFEILPQEFSEKLDQYGTKLILTIKESIDLDDLIQVMEKIIELSMIPTKIIIDEINLGTEQFRSLKEKVKSKLPELKRYNTKSIKMYQNSTELYEIIITRSYPQTYEKNTFCFLLNVPIIINVEKLNHGYFNCYINMKNEKIFNPHVSRDYLTIEAEKKIIDLVNIDIEIFNNNDRIARESLSDIMDFINDQDRWFKYEFPNVNIKSLNSFYMDTFTNCMIQEFKNLPHNYEIKGICIINNYNKNIMSKLYNLGYLCFTNSKNNWRNIDEYFEGFSSAIEVLKNNGIKTKLGVKSKKSKIYQYNKKAELKYIFKVDIPENYVSYLYENIGFSSSSGIELSDIQDILKNKIFFTTYGYKTALELQGYSVEYSKEIYKKRINNFTHKTAYINDIIDIQLLCLMYNIHYGTTNLIHDYIGSYDFNSKSIKELIFSDILDIHQVRNMQQLELILKLDAIL